MSDGPPPPPPGNPQQPQGQPNYGGMQPPGSGVPQPPSHGQPPMPGHGAPGYGSPSAGLPATMEQPQAVRVAQIMMYIGAALAGIGVILTILSRDAIVDVVRDSAGPELTDSQINGLATVSVVIGVLFGLIGVGLWVWMAIKNGQGKSWARVTATVFFGLSVVSTLINLGQPSTGAQKGFSLLALVLGGVIIYLLWGGKGSKEYFQVMSQK